VGRLHPFAVEAIVLLPDHLHMILALPLHDANFSLRVGGIKRRFTELYLAAGGKAAPVGQAPRRQRYRGIWQPRFWEHTIRDARDFKLHLDYIHANPLKHGLVRQVGDWPWSSFHRYLKLGEYEADWAGHVSLPHEVEYFYAD
jgi:putative transposase